MRNAIKCLRNIDASHNTFLKDRRFLGMEEYVMESIADSVMNELSSGGKLSAISKSVGGDETAVKSALGMSVPLVLGAMANHASTPAGTEMLTKTLAQAGTSTPLGTMSGLMANPASASGSGILDTLLGSQIGTIQNASSQKTGLPPAAVSQVMAIAVPVIMGQVGKMFAQQKVDPGNLQGVLADHTKAALQSSPEAASLVQHLPPAAENTGGFSGLFKKVLGK
jgi:hypothetical protein